MSEETNRSDTKYGESLKDKQWAEKRRDSGSEEKVVLQSSGITIEIIHIFDPDEDYGYGRKKYELLVSPPQNSHTDEWVVSYARILKWKGNYFRKSGEIDYVDLPGIVKSKAAEILPVGSPSHLNPEYRVIDPNEDDPS